MIAMPSKSAARPNPEHLLKQVEAEERYRARGKLKIFLGYAGGVGKSFRMLDEGRRRKQRGQDVVLAAMQSDASPEVMELAQGFERIAPIEGPGGQAINLRAVLLRRPQVCLIDGLAYHNPPGSKNANRWQDVEELLAAGISVITSINVQYVLERQAQVEAIRGKHVKESVPESFLHQADEIEVVDAPPEYCLTRTLQDSRDPESDSIAFGRQLSEMREIALLLAAEVVDHQLEEYLRRQGIAQVYGTHERILVCITPRSNASLMLYRGRRQADRFHGELHVLYVEQRGLSEADRATLTHNLEVARDLKAHVETLQGDDIVEAILRYASTHGITQIFVGHSQRHSWFHRWKANPVERLILEADGIDIRIFPHSESPHE